MRRRAITVCLLATTALGCAGSSPQNTSSNAMLEVTDWRVDTESHAVPDAALDGGAFDPALADMIRNVLRGRSVTVSGEIRNLSPHALKYVQVHFTLRDENGRAVVADDGIVDVDRLLAGESARWSAIESNVEGEWVSAEIRCSVVRGFPTARKAVPCFASVPLTP